MVSQNNERLMGNRMSDTLPSAKGESRTVEVLAHIAQIVASNKSLDTVLQAATNLMRTMLGLERCSVMLLDESREALCIAAATGLPRDVWHTVRIPVGTGISGKVVYERKPVLIEDITKSEFADAAHVERYSSRSFISVPLMVQGEVVGVLNANSPSEAAHFSRDDLERMIAIAAFLALAIETHRLREKSVRTELYLNSLLQSLDIGVLAVSANYRVLFCNPALCYWMGEQRHYVEGRNFSEIWPASSRDAMYALLFECIETGQPRSGEIVRPAADEGLRLLQVQAVPFLNEEGRVAGVFIFVKDLTGAREAEELRRLHGIWSDFIAIMSHELRTPLTAMKGAIHLLKGPEQVRDDVQRENLYHVLEKNTERLTHVLTNLMDVVMLERDVFEIRKEMVSLAPLLEEALQPYRAAADAKRLLVRIDVQDCHAHVDPGQFKRLVSFLVDNAVKFTPRDGEVAIRLLPEGEHVLLEVRDSGCGMDLETKANLFARFSQGEPPLRRKAGGLGLGLYLAKAIVDVHDGTIEVESEEGQGTLVRVRLPLAVEHA